MISAGEAFDPSPDNIDSRIVEGKFKNGMEYSMITKETRGDAVVVSLP